MADTPLSNYRIERVTRKSLKDLKPLYKAVFQKKYSIEYLEKKFDTIRFGAEYIGYIAYFGNKAIAFYTVFPCVMEYKGQRILTAQSGDTMTHPEHRRKGLFIYLANKTFELARISGIQFLFGFPNANSYDGFIKNLSWKHEANMNLYIIKVNTLPLANLVSKSLLFKFLYEYLVGFIKVFYKQTPPPSGIFCKDEDNIQIKYNDDYFNYKSYGGNFSLNIAGVAVWMKINGALLIGDMEDIAHKNSKQFLRYLRRFAFFTGCRHIIFNLSGEIPWNKQLSQYTIAEKGFPIAYYDFNSGLPLSKLLFSFSALDSF